VTADPFSYLFSLEQFGIKFGLDNIRALVAALAHPERAFASIHIAGTNGKGSVTAFVDAALRAAGHRTGRYTSPHLVNLTERFVIDGQPVSEERLAAAITRVRAAVERLRATGALAVHPTFFEVTTAAAFEVFREGGVEVAVCEVGLGGRLDATNVLLPMVCAITTIGRDHEQYLGTTLTAIATEKAGIAKPDVPLVVGRLDEESARAVAEIARDRGAPVVDALAGVTVAETPAAPDGAQAIMLATPARDYGRLALIMEGRHQVDNAIVAVRILELLDARGVRVPPQAVADGLRAARWPGRLERVTLDGGREILLDAAHNPDGAAALAEYLGRTGALRPLVFAAMRDKDVRGMLARLLPHASAAVVTRASNPRSAEPQALAEIARALRPGLIIRTAESPRVALEEAWRLGATIVVAGSIFLLADVLSVLDRP
jgi:dihydrofolate synthase/folylpolyglutamate synthase